MKIKLLVPLFLLCFTGYSQNWVKKADLPSHVGVSVAISFSANGKLYVGAGHDGVKSYKTFYVYDPLTDQWDRKADLPDSVYSACSFALNGKGYVVCGADPALTTKVYAYDPLTNTWQTKNNFPGSGRQNLGGCSMNGKGYLCGGFIGGNTCGSDMWQYNDTMDTWTQMASMPGPGRNGTFPITMNNRIYVGLGSNSSGSSWYSDFYCFNPDSNTYTRVHDLPAPSGGNIFFSLHDKGYIGLGSNGIHYDNIIYEYDPANDSWTQTDTFNGGSRFVAFSQVVNGKPYIGCGQDNVPNYYFDNWTWDGATTGVNKIDDNAIVSIYPNPTRESIRIETAMPADGQAYTLCDMTGRNVIEGELKGSNTIVSLHDIVAGIYILHTGAISYKVIKE